MSWLEDLPERDILLNESAKGWGREPLKVNNHIHTPFSFSAFETIDEAVALAAAEDIKLLGINDFYVTDGYDAFIRACMKREIFPLLNIELIGINKADQENGIRVNDPGNPGRTYISGKGLKFPVELSEKLNEKLADVINEAHKQISEMIDLLNDMLRKQGVEISLSMEEIINKHALKLIRERHIAKVLRIKVEELASGDWEFGDLLEKIYGFALSLSIGVSRS